MSRKIIGEGNDLPDRELAGYRKGDGQYDHGLLEDVVKTFEAASIKRRSDDEYIIPKDLTSRIHGSEEMDGQAFVDDLIRRIRRAKPLVGGQADSLVSAVVNELHKEGHNELTIDYQSLQGYGKGVSKVGRHLKGKMSDPLVVHYILADNPEQSVGYYIGERSSDATMYISGGHGKIKEAGSLSRGSSFYLPSPPLRAGIFAKDSIFYVDDVRALLWGRRYGDYLLTLTDSEGKDTPIRLMEFYEGRNRIFVRWGEHWRPTRPGQMLQARHQARKSLGNLVKRLFTPRGTQ